MHGLLYPVGGFQIFAGHSEGSWPIGGYRLALTFNMLFTNSSDALLQNFLQ